MVTKRKIVQLVAPNAKCSGSAIFALCDDGSVWATVPGPMPDQTPVWYPLPPIPQPAEDAPAASEPDPYMQTR